MNPTAEQLGIIRRLRDLSRSWVNSLRETVQAFSTISAGNPNYPLPSDFPFTNMVIQEKIRWIEEVGGEGKRYAFNVYLEYKMSTSNDWAPASWTLKSGLTILGLVEVDYRIMHDRDAVLSINTDFVLEMMCVSLQRENPIRLSSRVIPNVNPVVYPGLHGNIEISELRTFDGVLVSELARRIVGQRSCTMCGALLPPAGPGVCIFHLLN